MEILVLLGFFTLLLLSIIFDFSLLYALAGGLIIFLVYAAFRGFSPREMLSMVVSGILKAKNILMTFLLNAMVSFLIGTYWHRSL